MAVAEKAPAGGARFLTLLLSAVSFLTPFKGKGEVYKLPEIHVEETRYHRSFSIIRLEKDEEWKLKQDIGEIVNEIQGIYVKEYGGKGGVKSPILRGADSQQTLLLIEGLKLLPRPYDLSILPVDFFEEVEIYFSSPSTLYGADAIGGAINLKDDVRRAEGLTLSILEGAFSTLSLKGNGSRRIKELNLYGKAFYSLTSGDYPYLIKGEKGKVINNQAESYGFRAGINGERRWGRFSVSIIGFSRDKGVPGSIYTPTPEAKQYDRYGCIIGSLSLPLKNNLYLVSSVGSSFYSIKFYDNVFILSSYPSRFEDIIFNGRSVVRWNSKFLNLEGGVEFYYHRRDGSSVGIRNLKNFSFQTGAFVPLHKLPELSIFLSQRTDFFNTFSDRTVLRSGFTLNWDFLELSVGTGTSYRVPTFNELYWKEDAFSKGNPELKPEKGFDTGVTFKTHFPATYDTKVEFGFSYLHISDMILWNLWDGKWSPQNISKANILQTFMKVSFSIMHIKPSLILTYTNSDSSIGELPYRPRWNMNGEIGFEWNNLFGVLRTTFIGNRYGSYGGSGNLPWHIVVSGSAGVSLRYFFIMFKYAYTFCEENTCMNSAGYPIPLYDVSFITGIKTI